MPELSDFAAEIRDWLTDHADELSEFRRPHPGPIEATWELERRLHRTLYDAGLLRWGWPSAAGGFGGSPLLRAVLHEELGAAGLPILESLQQLEVIGSTVIAFAPSIAAEYLPAALRGDELWCMGSSEPDAGSDLASVRTRAEVDGDCYRLNGQKIWTSGGHLSRWCTLLARTGRPEDRHRGLTLFWLDLTSKGVEVRPIACANGRNEVSEIFLDDVLIPGSCVIGDVNGGWRAIMHFMQYERGNFAWVRQAWLHARLAAGLAVANVHQPSSAMATVGDAYLSLCSLRARALGVVTRLAAGEYVGPEISEVKILLADAEQTVFDAIRRLNVGRFEFGDDPNSALIRQEWSFSRAVTIYGGAAEVQRDLVAERVMGLPRSESLTPASNGREQ